jgi:hypothetical protein
MTEFSAGTDTVYFLCFGNNKMAVITSNVNFVKWLPFDEK